MKRKLLPSSSHLHVRLRSLGCIVAHAVTSDRSKASEQEQDASERVDAVNEQEQYDSEKG